MARLSLLFQMRLNPSFVSKIFEKIKEEQLQSLIRLLFFEAKFREKIKECLNAIAPGASTYLVLARRRLKLRKIAVKVGISKNRMGHILHEILDIRKVSTRWVPLQTTSAIVRLLHSNV